MDFKLFYPDFKEKALTFSYDDGQVFDRRLVALFNQYGLKATFHLNSGILGRDGFVAKEELPTLYEGHEVACHGVFHEYPTHLAKEHLVQEFYQDRLNLEAYTGRIVRGCSYAFGEYDDHVTAVLKSLGIVYSRTVESTGGFRVPQDFLRWTPSCHHNDAFDGKLVELFLNKPDYRRLPLFYIWGHSFEFEREGTWDKMEQLCDTLSGQEDVWYTTNIDFYDYVTAARRLVFSADGRRIMNLSAIPVYAEVEGERRVLKGEGFH